MNVIVLGAGLSGISTAFFLQNLKGIEKITLIEKEIKAGGLCRSISKDGYIYDIGPHIIFSKDKEMLTLMEDVLDDKNKLKRSNKIFYKGRHIQYPFENDLSNLPKEDLNYCIRSFNHNPYEDYKATNMIQFFLKTFGEGITNTYLRPYNEKIWKYDPAFMNTDMVERIPKPTPEEIKRSAEGETIDGYLHQLYFTYPSTDGIKSVVDGFRKRLNNEKCEILVNNSVNFIEKSTDNMYRVRTDKGIEVKGELVISTIPIQELTRAYIHANNDLRMEVNRLRYNSIAIAFIKTKYDKSGDNFTFTIPDKNIIFHRISKMDFLGKEYHNGEGATYIVEVTYRKNDYIDVMPDTELLYKIKQGICTINFAEKESDIEVINLTKHEYAYVIYDLNHKENMNKIRRFYQSEGILLNGRFGNFEYWNMDRILRESLELSKKIEEKIK